MWAVFRSLTGLQVACTVVLLLFEWLRAAAPVVAALLLPFWRVRSGVRWLLSHWTDRGAKPWGWAASLANLALAGILLREAGRLGDSFWFWCAIPPSLIALLSALRLVGSATRQRPSWKPPLPRAAPERSATHRSGAAHSSAGFASVSIRFD